MHLYDAIEVAVADCVLRQRRLHPRGVQRVGDDLETLNEHTYGLVIQRTLDLKYWVKEPSAF